MSKTLAWSACLTSVADSAVLKAARSSSGTYSSARMASRSSVMETGSPAARSSWTKPDSRSSIRPGAGTSMVVGSLTGIPSSRSRLGDLQLLLGPLDVALVLEEHVERAADHVGGHPLHPEVDQRAGPVDRLRDRRRLLQVELADGPHDPGDLVGQRQIDTGHPHPHDLLLPFGVGVVEGQEEAT